MGVKAGYKQTDIGLIPEDWTCAELGTIAQVKGGKRLPAGFTLVEAPTPHPYIRVSDMLVGGINSTAIKYVPQEASAFIARYRIYTKDIFISVAGSLGIVGIIPLTLNGANLTENADRITDIKCNQRYLMHWLLSNRIQNLIKSIMTVGAQPKLALGRIAGFQIALPSKSVEQQAIANALSDVDQLIASLDQLIAKKRDLKQAAMQQLLTGKTRLQGFSEEWRKTIFAKVVRHHAGNSSLIKGKLSQENLSGFYPAYSASGQDVWRQDFEHEGQAIIVSAVGSRCGKSFLANDKWSAIANTHVVWPNTSMIIIQFLQRFLNNEDFWMKGGSGQPFVQFKKTFEKSLLLPEPNEQKAIVEVLSDMDAELTELEQRRDKTIALKQGMMQELLTGRTRLV